MLRAVATVCGFVSGAFGFSEKVRLPQTDFWGGDLFSYSNTDAGAAWNQCILQPGCTMFTISGGTTYLKSLVDANSPTHNEGSIAYLMADQAIQSVWDLYWWKKIECVDWQDSGDVFSWKIEDNIQDNIKKCEDASSCDVMSCGSGKCWGKNIAKLGKSNRDCNRDSYVMEHTPYWGGLGSNTSRAWQEELHNSSHVSEETNISVNASGEQMEAIAGSGAQLALRDGSKDDSATWVKGIVAVAFAEEDPEALIQWVVQSLSGAFTHKRTISVNVKTPSSMKRFEHWYNYADDGVQFVWEHTDYGLHLTYHDNGPISGCQAFRMDGCDHQLFVAASNPAVGHNKVRVAFGPSSKYDDGHGGGRTCYNVWDDMDSWGEQEGGAHLLPEWNNYDNPSSISFGLDAVASCSSGSIIEV